MIIDYNRIALLLKQRSKRFLFFIVLFLHVVLPVSLYPQDALNQLFETCKTLPIEQKISRYAKASIEYINTSPIQSIAISNAGILLSVSTKDFTSKVYFYNTLSHAYSIIGNTDTAIYFSRQSLALSQQLNNMQLISVAFNNLANVYTDKGLYLAAIDNYLKSLTFIDTRDSVGYSQTLVNIGLLYGELGLKDKELDYYLKGLDIGERQNNQVLLSITYENLGTFYESNNNFDKALFYFKKALKISKSVSDLQGLADIQENMGRIYIKQNRLSDAYSMLTSAFNYAKEIDDRQLLIEIYLSFGNHSVLIRDYPKAKNYFNTALNSALGLNLQTKVQKCYLELSKLYELTADSGKAFYYYKKYNEIHDTLFTNEKNRQIAMITEQYTDMEKEKEIQLLRKDNEIKDLNIARQNTNTEYLILISILCIGIAVVNYILYRHKKKAALTLAEINKKVSTSESQLQELNASKDKFFSIIAHDLKNPFVGLLGLSNALKDGEYLTTEERERLTNSLYSLSHSTYNLLDNLLVWAKSQQGRITCKPEKVNLVEIIENSIEIQVEAIKRKHIKIHNTIDHDTYVLADQNMLFLIFRNLISNAIKFSHPHNKIDIFGSAEGTDVIISIRDYGIGIHENLLNSLFKIESNSSTKGTIGEIGSGLGLILVKEFVDKNGGIISVISELNVGSMFNLTLPLFTQIPG